MLGLHLRTKQERCKMSDLGSLFIISPRSCYCCRSADTLQLERCKSIAYPANEQCHISTLATAIRMQFIKDEELESLCGLDEIFLSRSREEELQHHIVCEEDIRRVGDDPLLVLL